MRGDFSRGVSARPGVSRVLMQQGRVQLDADWNEAAAVADRRARLFIADLLGGADPVGVAAVPRDHAGFAIAARGGYRFDGHAHLHVAAMPSLGGREPFAIEATIAPRRGGRGGTIAGRFAQPHRGRAHGEVALRVDAHGRLMLLRVEDGRVRTLIARGTLPFDVHTDVAAVCDGVRIELFVGGRLAAARAVGPGDREDEVPFLVGAHAAQRGVDDGFDGAIDRLAIAACPHRHHHHRHGAAQRERCRPEHFTLADAHAHAAAHGKSHAPQPVPERLVAGAGRAYVGGMLCEAEAETQLAVPDGDGTLLAYLEVWERLVSAADDPDLLDPALGGIDTSAAVRTEARVRIAPLDAAVARMHAASARGTMTFTRAYGATQIGNQLVRVEVHRSGVAGEATFAFDDPRLLDGVRVDAHTFRVVHDPGWSGGQPVRLVAEGGKLSAITAVGVVNGAYTTDETVPETAFRVAPIATVKWSRDNASVAFALDATADASDRFTIDDPQGRVAALQPSSDPSRTADAVEISSADDADEGRPGRLVALADLDTDEPGRTTVVLAEAVGPIAGSGLLRVWSSFDGGVEARVDAGKPLTLAPGLTVTFSSGTYASGDFWWTPVRDDVDGLWGWPMKDGQPLAMPPSGVERRFAPLALLEPRTGDLPSVVDLRRIVEPLADDDDPLLPPAPGGDRAGEPAPPPRPAPREPEVVVREERGGETVVDVREPDGREIVVDVHAERPDEYGAALLSAQLQAPEGYRFTGMTVAQHPSVQRWETLGDAPANGPALACTIGRVAYALFEVSGTLWARDLAAGAESATWRRCADRGYAFQGGALVAHEGVVYALGGVDDAGRPTARCDAYDPERDAWDPMPRLRTARAYFGAVVLAGRIVAMGGVRRAPALGFAFASRRVESWTPGELRWRREPDMDARRQGCAAVGRGRRAYLIGGASGRFFAGERRYGASVDAVAPFEGTSWPRGALLSLQRDARAVLCEDTMIVVGGRMRDGDFALPERYVLGADGGEPLPELERLSPGVAVSDGTVYAIGGESAFRATSHVERLVTTRPLYVHARER